MSALTILDFAGMVGCNPSLLPKEIKEQFDKYDFSYELIDDNETESLVNAINHTLKDNLSVSGKDRQQDWEAGWSENLEAFKASGYDVDALLPRYFHSDRPLRLQRSFIKAGSPRFEWDFSTIYRKSLFAQYLQDVDNIYEFGCGAGHNLAMLGKMFPDKKLFGYDWAEASIEILDLMREHSEIDVSGRQFNFFSPDQSVEIAANSAVLTYHALEQTGSDYHPFLEFIIARQPSIIVNVECLLELYDESAPIDQLAIAYHKKRNYLEGYVEELRGLERKGKIQIVDCRRTGMGSFYHEAYSHIIWNSYSELGFK